MTQCHNSQIRLEVQPNPIFNEVGMKSLKLKKRLIEMRAEGMSYQLIAKELGIAKQTAINWAKELEVEIHNAQAFALDALVEKHFMSKKSRIDILCTQLNKIKTNIDNMDYYFISKDKLFDMEIKLLNALKKEQAGLSFITRRKNTDSSNISEQNYERISLEN